MDINGVSEDKEKFLFIAAILSGLGGLGTVIVAGGRVINWLADFHQGLSNAGLPFLAPTLVIVTSIFFPLYLTSKFVWNKLEGESDD